MNQIVMRAMPQFLQPLMDLCLPWPWKYKACLRAGKKVLIPEVQRRRERQRRNAGSEKSIDLLQAMVEMTSPDSQEGQDEVLAELMLNMTAIAGHSTAASGSYALFDLVSRPEYIDIMREEALGVLENNGMCFTKQVFGNMRKMDSFLREYVLPSLLHSL
jgi:cytochrome P450 monooxygenase